MKIKEICERFSAGKSIKANQIYESGLYPVYGGNGLRGYTNTYNFDGDCAIIGRQGAYCGNVRYFSGKAYMTEHAIVATTKKGFDTRYFSYKLSLMNLGQFQGQSAQPGLSVDTLSLIDVDMPRYQTQVKIGLLIEAINNKIKLNNSINDNLEQQIQSIYQYLFMQFDFPNEMGKPYRFSGGKMIQNDMLKRNIPATWKVKTLGELCSFQNGINYDKGTIGDKSYHIINVRNISSSSFLLVENELDIISLPHKKGDKYCVSSDSIIIARSGIPGATRLLFKPSKNTIFCGFVICCTPTDKELQYYLTFYLKLLEGSSATQTGGSILQNVSQDTLSSLPIPIPPKELLDEFNQTVLQTFELIHTNMNETSQLIDLRDWLLPMLMNGQAAISD